MSRVKFVIFVVISLSFRWNLNAYAADIDWVSFMDAGLVTYAKAFKDMENMSKDIKTVAVKGYKIMKNAIETKPGDTSITFKNRVLPNKDYETIFMRTRSSRNNLLNRLLKNSNDKINSN
ncbi:uncharacterized protein LOC135949111 [Calliphora vicina]|uniref:uncharacterized protein LOC135949111 n=1 Tax=Calliphora vicina TaxID=7373 RepID=UPI00325B48D2